MQGGQQGPWRSETWRIDEVKEPNDTRTDVGVKTQGVIGKQRSRKGRKEPWLAEQHD